MASTRHERGFDPRVDLGDSRLRISTEMTTTYNHDEVASPEMTAKAWDDYLHRCGAGAYISAVRFFGPRHDAQSLLGSSGPGSRRSITTPS